MTETTENTATGDAEGPRREKLQRIIERGIDPWGHRFDDRMMIGDIAARASEIKYRLETGEELELPDLHVEGFDFRQWKADQGKGSVTGPQVRAAGRIMLNRTAGKLIFIDIKDWTGSIQLFIGKKQVGEDDFSLAKECFDLGDLIGVDGQLAYTNTGELTIFAERLHFLTKSLNTPPAKHIGMTDPELIQRRRYVDLAYNEGAMERFLNRTKIVDSMRRTLRDDGFCEVEGPTLHGIAGGAAARPFITNHNALGIELFLRIALELHLKRLMVGGIERVFELGRVYRNEGISPRHNPEFTMLEVYQAYGDYESMMDLTEQLIQDGLDAIGGARQIEWGDATIDFSPPFARRTYDDLFAEHTGVAATDTAAVAEYAKSLGVETAGRHPDVIKNEVFEGRVEDQLTGPVFVIDYPASICPLTKRKRDNPAVAERFELFIQGMELANAYTELNDPDLQEELFRTQLDGLSEEDSMAKMDHDFVRALRHGMPPAGGLGVGVDRLVMLMTGSTSIRDVILFPLLRPE
ncbi:MAG: lysine--tRNA ligase [Pirellulaceae bacterium]|jgi:lysyl-tRNA synthetase class 2|nr:lysine--tRNA ligase [Pirellulaceae bacterium]MDP7014830.1 lysine--tRNA ligase [Pirellulaceae bacterium]